MIETIFVFVIFYGMPEPIFKILFFFQYQYRVKGLNGNLVSQEICSQVFEISLYTKKSNQLYNWTYNECCTNATPICFSRDDFYLLNYKYASPRLTFLLLDILRDFPQLILFFFLL